MSYTNGLDDPSAYFQTTLYSGTGGSHSITNTGNSDLQPDWVWVKSRSFAADHELFDSVRGAGKALISNGNYAESSGRGVNSFDSDGFSIVNAQAATNTSGQTYTAWQWKAGTSFTNDASATGIGSIDSAGSVNTDAGFSICSFTGTGGNGTVKHGLSTVPKMIIFKNRPQAEGWIVYHQAISNTHFLTLNTTGVAVDNATMFNDTSPTSSVFSVGSNHGTNGPSHAMIAYCFADVKGYSKFGSYTGNGNADGTFVYTGFKPAFVIAKESSEARDWQLWDNKRLGYNASGGNKNLIPNKTDAEDTYADIDILSNGFKLRNLSAAANKVSQTYIYMAFAENPFVTSTGVPATAR